MNKSILFKLYAYFTLALMIPSFIQIIIGPYLKQIVELFIQNN